MTFAEGLEQIIDLLQNQGASPTGRFKPRLIWTTSISRSCKPF